MWLTLNPQGSLWPCRGSPSCSLDIPRTILVSKLLRGYKDLEQIDTDISLNKYCRVWTIGFNILHHLWTKTLWISLLVKYNCRFFFIGWSCVDLWIWERGDFLLSFKRPIQHYQSLLAAQNTHTQQHLYYITTKIIPHLQNILICILSNISTLQTGCEGWSLAKLLITYWASVEVWPSHSLMVPNLLCSIRLIFSWGDFQQRITRSFTGVPRKSTEDC